MSIIIAGIHTDIGKTLCATIVCEMWGYDYWKPVQAGHLEKSDAMFVRQHVQNPTCVVHPEAFSLTTAASPHYAAEVDRMKITAESLKIPSSPRQLVIETAGGLMSPLSAEFTNIDIIKQWGLSVIIVSNNYLGSINHTLLSVELLRQRLVPIAGLVFSGKENLVSQSFILTYTKLPLLFSIPYMRKINQQTIQEMSHQIAIPSL